MKRVIGRGRKSGGLYILEIEVPKFVACFGVVTPIRLTLSLESSFSLSIKEAIFLVF